MVGGAVAVGVTVLSTLLVPAPAVPAGTAGTAGPPAVAAGVPAPPAGSPAPPAGSPAPPAVAAAQDDLSVTVSREGDLVVAGRLTTYRITVTNPAPEPATVTVRASTPRQLTELTATVGARTRDGVDWTPTVPAKGSATMLIAGVYTATSADGADRPYRVALTACAVDGDGLPLSCDTDIADLESAGLLDQWWWVAVPFAGVGVWLVRRRRRRADRTHTPGAAEELVLDLGVLERPKAVGAGRSRNWRPRPAARSRSR